MRKTKFLMLANCLLLCASVIAVRVHAADYEPAPSEVSRYGGICYECMEIYEEVMAEEPESEEAPTEVETESEPETETETETEIETETEPEPIEAPEENSELNVIYEDDKSEEMSYNETIPEEPVLAVKGSYNIPSYSGMKSWMSWRNITSTSSPQYKLQQLAWTDHKGFRLVDDRYCIAVGMYFNCEVGDWLDLVLENGTVIPCIVGDRKARQHTDSAGLFTSANNCMSEFIIDSGALDGKVRQMGNCSYREESWGVPVVTVILYEANSLNATYKEEI